jgi:hypothetical protein
MNRKATKKRGSADWQSAVSPTGSRQNAICSGVEKFFATTDDSRRADCQSAIQQTASLRYGHRFIPLLLGRSLFSFS